MKKNIFYLFIVMMLFALSGCADQTTAVANTAFEQDSHEVMAQVSMPESGDIYVPLTIPDLVQSGQTLIEFTLIEVLSTSIEGAPQGWVGNNHNQFLLRVENVLLDGSWVREPYIGEEITILSHRCTEYFEGQRYLTFVHFDIINNQKEGVPPGMTPYSLDNRVTAIVNEDRTITSTISLGFYLREFDGYTIEQMMESIQGYQVPALAQPDPPRLHGLDIASEWASESISRAHSLGLIPHSLFAFPTFTNYTLPITRAEFTALAVALYEAVLGEVQALIDPVEFNDTTDVNVQIMATLGVVTGVGNNRFDPDSPLTREQAAVILDRLAGLFGVNSHNVFPRFDDNQDISEWAILAVGHMQAREIMGGTGNNMFSPRGEYTRQQSVITILRLFDLIQESPGTGTGIHVNVVANANISVQSATPQGISFVISNPEDRTFIYGEDYRLNVLVDNAWVAVAPIIDNWGFTSIGYDLFPQSTTDIIHVNWEWLFGELPSGFYEFSKEIIYLRSPGDFDTYILSAYFSIE